MSRWNQAICELDWIEQFGERRPVRLKEPETERCSWCGKDTQSGIYVRADPATVPYPPEASDDD